ncbi:MAG TPA: SDR family oxidoreductase [Caulobacteraceae bacterium]|jgi:short-subunit dehydrogenase|nr:SDR family oxidoreductase [Caulobacteraceae bacterium]
MTRALKPLAEQVIVITGATSGVGLATARAAAERGAALVLVARNETALAVLGEELLAKGARVEAVAADVGDQVQIQAAAAVAEATFGGFDTWINDAGAAIYGRIEDTPVADQRALFETNYWGVVYGSLAAVEGLKTRSTPGALINVGSVLSDQALPIQGVYSAAKHAVKGFTNALRMELIRSHPKISVTLIKPSVLDTPYKEHARNYTGHPASSPPPVYDPALAAEAILYAAEHRTREITVGGGGAAFALFGQLIPSLAEPLFAWAAPLLQRDRAAGHARDSENLRRPGRDLSERTGAYPFVRRTSWYTRAQMNPELTAGLLAAGGTFLWLALTTRRALKVAHIKAVVRAHEREKQRAREAKVLARHRPKGTRS